MRKGVAFCSNLHKTEPILATPNFSHLLVVPGAVPGLYREEHAGSCSSGFGCYGVRHSLLQIGRPGGVKGSLANGSTVWTRVGGLSAEGLGRWRRRRRRWRLRLLRGR